MSEQLYYTKKVTGNQCVLDAEEALHCIKVLRMRKGDELRVTDGNGGIYLCRIINDNLKNCELQIISQLSSDHFSKPIIHIATALTKNPARFEWFVEKAIETGVSRITPIDCKNSEKVTFKRERIEKLAVAAMKQSLRIHLPIIDDVMKFNNFVEKYQYENRYIALMEHPHILQIDDLAGIKEDVVFLTGPEGDFTFEEVEIATRHGFKPISFGNFRLRTETAALYSCILANLMICLNRKK